jgi:hypothetical protein
MFLRTLLFFVVMYFLVKLISRFFLKSGNSQKRRGGVNFFYRTFKQMAQQQRQNNQRQHRQGANDQSASDGSQQFEGIEEAEFEEITDEDKSSSQ